MQLRSTTPALSVIPRWLLTVIVLTVLCGIAGNFSPATAESNIDRQKRIDELSKEIDNKVSSSRELNTQTSDIQSQIATLNRERNYLAQQIQKNTADQQSLEKKITATETSLEAHRSLLGTIMANLYVEGSISPLEMLASSTSVADYIDAQTFRESMNKQLSASIDQVKQTKVALLAQKIELVRVAGDQKNQTVALGSRQAEQNQLLVATQNQNGELTKITATMAAERKELQQQQQQNIVSQMSGATQVPNGTISEPVVQTIPIAVPPPAPTANPPSTSVTPAPSPAPAPSPPPPVVLPNGGYPNYLQNCYVDSNALSYGIDPWGYGCRQCVSYTAWKVLQKTGRSAMYWGNANQWPASARRVGYQTGISPRAQSVAVMTTGPYGHVAWVESINANGTLNVSQYNYWLPGKSNGGWGWYSEFRGVSPSTYQAYIYV